jgi:hypothetical protein
MSEHHQTETPDRLDRLFPDVAFDKVAPAEEAELYASVHTRSRPHSEAPVLAVDDPRSPAGEAAASLARAEAKREGDRYRAMSRATSMRGGG